MTAVLPETTGELANLLSVLPDAEPKLRAVLEAGLLRATGLTSPHPDCIQSIETGLTETFTAYDQRLTAKEARNA